MRNTLIACCMLLLASLGAHAQCTIQASYTKVCLGNTVSFSRTPATANDSAFLWNFGDGSTSQQAGTTYQYNQAGTYTVTLRIYRKGGTFCDATPLTITVFHKPIAAYQLVGNDTQCFNRNSFVFNDLSGPGASNAPIRRRTMLFGDGAFTQQSPPYPSTLTHSFTDAAGGVYVTVLEVEDTNGCLNQVVDTLHVLPKLTALFSFTQDVQCGKTLVRFYNQSEGDTVGLRNTWLYGDGGTGTQYTNFDYLYVGDTSYLPQLIIVNAKGCRDTAISPSAVTTFIPDSTIHIIPTNKRCFSNNEFTFTNKTKVPADNAFYWVIRKLDISYQTDSLQRTINSARFPSCGVYDISLYFFYNGCQFQTDTQVFVTGPKAILATSAKQPLNWVQCGAHDTVVFRPDDLNCYYENSSMKFFWDFSDPFAPACTTDTKNNQNVGINCRYSKDSLNVRHYYSQPNQYCYNVKMWAQDEVIGCADTANLMLRLSYPKVGYDSIARAPRASAFAQECSSQSATIFWDNIEPLCGAEKVWILPDTSCTNKSWILADSMKMSTSYRVQMSDICTSDSLVYFGIVARNGRDALGNYCYDTAYYPYTVKRPPAVLNFEIELIDQKLCPPHRVRIYTNDSIRKDIRRVIYNFGDGSSNYIQDILPTDSVIASVFHEYQKSGSYSLMVQYINSSNCSGLDPLYLKTGNIASLNIETPTVCNGAPAIFKARIRYESDTLLRNWSDTTRFIAGKEQLYWNFGDTNIWYPALERTHHTYLKTGIFRVRFAFKDSSAVPCFDTLQSPLYTVLVTSVVARAGVSADTFYCAPSIVTFTDSSYALFGSSTPNPSLITRRVWNFDAGKGSSTLYQPGIFYGENGTYQAKLYSESVYGCWDTTTKQVVILGPTPRFIITNDTFGCVPYTVKLKNTTGKQLRNWIWYFNDPANTIFSTGQDSDVTFTYTTPGVYRIDLLGEDRIYNPTTGSFKTCSQTFPYLDNPNAFHPRQVTVIPYDTLHIVTDDTVCVGVPFIAKTERGRVVDEVKWNWGDSGSSQLAWINLSVSHTYDSSGLYLVKVEPVVVSPSQCVLPDEKQIYAQQPKAAFDIDIKGYPEIRFLNQSSLATRFWWDFGDPLSGSNTSSSINTTHVFTSGDTLYKVCLSAFDARDCMDSVCKYISLKARVVIPNVFTPGNGDEKNDAFDIDIEGYELYELFIYNRWGTMVYESTKDGFRNDGINWNGKNKNNGEDCPEGVYYVVFKYKLITDRENQIYHGTVTLIRD